MKITLNNSEALEIVKKMGRLNQFGYEGWLLLIEHMEEIESMELDDKGSPIKEIEFDTIAICCDFTRYEDLKEFQDAYGEEYKTMEDIEDKTQVLYIGSEYDKTLDTAYVMRKTDAFIVSNF